MRRYTFILPFTFLLSVGLLPAQDFTVQLMMSPNPSPYLSDWEERTETVTMVVTNRTQNDREIRVKAEILEGGTLRAETKTLDMPIVPVDANTTQNLNAEQVIPLHAIELYGTSETAIVQTGKIPAGSYQICVTVLDAQTEQTLSAEVCQFFNLTSYIPPSLILPPDNTVLQQELCTTVLFSWTPVTPTFQGPFSYLLQVFEVLTGQDPIMAFQVNRPIIEEEVIGATQVLWPTDLDLPECGDYIWSVRAIDDAGRPITEPDGYAEPFTFTVVCPEDEEEEEEEEEEDGGDIATAGTGGDLVGETKSDVPDTNDIRNPEEKKDTSIVKIPVIDDSLRIETCGPVPPKSDPGSPISLGMTVDEPETFPYPRAVPVRAAALDEDYAVFRCEDCDELPGEKWIPVPDEIASYTWELNGPGSLNTPFDLDAIRSIEDSLAELTGKLGRVEDSIDLMGAEIEKIKKDLLARQEQAKKDLPEFEKKRKEIDSVTGLKKDTVKSATDTIGIHVAERKKEVDTIAYHRDTIGVRNDSIEAVTGDLRGDPRPSEQAKLDELAEARTTAVEADSAVVRKERAIQSEATRLDADVAAKETALTEATDAYMRKKEEAEALNVKIRSLRATLYSIPKARDYFGARRGLDLAVETFIARHFAGDRTTIIDGRDAVHATGEAALAVAPPAERGAGLTSFRSDVTTFLGDLSTRCASLGEPESSTCADNLSPLFDAFTAYDVALDELLATPYLLDPTILTAIAATQASLAGKESGIRAAELEVKEKGIAYRGAMKDRITAISALETERNGLATTRDEAWQSFETLETAWRAIVAEREEELELNRDVWIARLDSYERDRDSLAAEITRLRDSIAARDRDTARLAQDIERLLRKLAELEEERKDLDALIKDLERLLGLKPDEAVAEEAKRKGELEKERDELKNRIDALNKKKEELAEGAKSAEGPIVYYIPPPLEEIMKDTEEFERLKDSVAIAEQDLAAAEEYRRGSQGRLARLLDRIARELATMKQAEKAIEDLETEIAALETERNKVKNAKAQAYTDQQEELQNVLTRTEKKLEEIRRKKKAAEQQKAKTEQALEQVQTELEGLYRSYRTGEENLKTLRSQHDYELTTRSRLDAELEARRALLKREKESLLLLEDRLAQTINTVARTVAREDLRSEGSATVEVTAAEAAVSAQRTKVATIEADVASKATGLVTAEQRVQTAERSLVTAEKAQVDLRNTIRIAEEKLAGLNEQLEADRAGVGHWGYTEGKAEYLIEKTNEARREFQEKIAEDINEDEDVKSRTAEIARLEAELATQKSRLAKGGGEITTLMAKKKEEEKRAVDTVTTATEQLAKAEEKLRSFLLGEFKTVTFTSELTATAFDAGLDMFRVKEGSTKLVKKITYGGSRVPSFPNQVPSSSLAPRTIPGTCMPVPSFIPPGPIGIGERKIEKEEPRTIALLYRDGEPLWPEWPVIADTVPVLAKDVIELSTSGTDSDAWKQVCESDAQTCLPLGELGGGIRDVVTFSWGPTEQFINGHPFAHVLWEALEVEKPDCDKEFPVAATYTAGGVSADASRTEELELAVKPGVMIEIPDSLVGSPTETQTVRVRIVTGDHKGLAGEDVELRVTKKEGESEGFGFGAGVETVSRTTDENGYAEADFLYGEGFAQFEITAEWKRPGVCASYSFPAIAPLYLDIPLFTSGSPTVAWEGAKKVWGGDDAKAVLGSMPEYSDSLYASEIFAVAAHRSEDLKPVDDLTVAFEAKTAGTSVDPDSAKTELFGIARTVLRDVPEETTVAITASCEERFEPVGRPAEAEGEYNTSTIKEFRIGDADDLFAVVPEEPVSRGEPINGTGVLKGTTKGAFIKAFNGVELLISEVEVEEEGGVWVAKRGTVSWHVGDKKIEKSLSNFTFGLDSLVIRAGKGAGIGGRVEHTTLTRPVNFYAEMNTAGEFFGEVTSLPEIEIAKFKLKEGASFAIDMHNSVSEPGFENAFRGIVIRQASLELPPVFNGRNGAPSTLIAKDFAVSSSGFEGSLSLTGSFLTLGYAGYRFEADSVGLEFSKNRIVGGGFRGGLSLASPMEGTILLEIARSGEEWKGMISTKNPVSIPRLKTTFSLGSGTGITWNSAKKLGTLRLNGTINSPKVGDIEITGFEFNSKGEIKLEKMAVGKEINVADRFRVKVEHLSFYAVDGDYGMTLAGGLVVPAIGVDKLAGTVTLAPGPKLSFAFDSARIHFSRGPVDFAGMFAWGGKEFRGDFDIGLKKLGKGISGTFIVGSTEDEKQKDFTYWYAEMSLKTAIAMGQSGLAMTEIGGGVGWNYHPPVGLQEGTPSNDGSFSFKAILGLGNVAVPLTSSGNLFAGRMTMVLVPGRFTLNGKAWLLDNEESMFGEGQLNLRWSPVAKMDGYLRMGIGLPDAEGEIFDFAGKINFDFSGSKKSIKSEYLRGSVMKKVNAAATIDITEEKIDLDGKVWYDLKREYSALGVGLDLDLNVSSGQGVEWLNKPKKLDAHLDLTGRWDVNITLPVFGTYDLASGEVGLKSRLKASPTSLLFTGKVFVSWNLLGFRGSKHLDVGYSSGI